MPVGNIGYRLIMSATPLLLETTGAGRVQNPAYRASGQIKKPQPHGCDFFISHNYESFQKSTYQTLCLPGSMPHTASPYPMDTNFRSSVPVLSD